jgi:hypothetical protein
MFPIIPGVLEFHAWVHRRPDSKPWLTTIDRLSLRTFAIGLTFLIVVLYFNPQTAFVALSTRGDWMLDGAHDRGAVSARRVLFAAAGGLEWLYHATKTNPYTAHIDTAARQRSEEAEQELAKQQGQDSAARHEHAGVKQDGAETSNETDQEVAVQDDTEVSQNVSNANDDATDTTEKQQNEVVQKHNPSFVELANAVVIVKNPDNQWLMAGLEQNGKQIGTASTPTNSETAQLERALPDKGTYRLNMFVNKDHKYGQYDFVGSVDFVNR